MDDIARVNHAKSCDTNCLVEAVEKAKGHIQTLFGCGPSFGYNKSPYPNESNFFDSKSLNKDFLEKVSRFDRKTLRGALVNKNWTRMNRKVYLEMCWIRQQVQEKETRGTASVSGS